MSFREGPLSSVTRTDRTPLRDVQNELLGLQQLGPSASLKAGTELDSTLPKTKNENVRCISDSLSECTTPAQLDSCHVQPTRMVPTHCDVPQDTVATDIQGDITFKSFICSGGEIELSDRSALSETSALVGSLMFDSRIQSLCNESEVYEENAEMPQSNTHHADHPYCNLKDTSVSLDTIPANASSFTLNTTQPTAQRIIGAVCEISSANHTTITDTYTELPASGDAPSDSIGDLTYKSLSCSGGELEIGDASRLPENSLLVNEQITQSQASVLDVSDNGEIGEDLLSTDQHDEHPYCHVQKHLAQTALGASSNSVSTVSDTLEISDSTTNAMPEVLCVSLVQRSDETDAHTLPSLHEGLATSTVDQPSASRFEGVTFKSLTCSGVEIQVSGDVSVTPDDSVPLPDSAFENQSSMVSSHSENTLEVSEAMQSKRDHIDHPYCNFKISTLSGDEDSAMTVLEDSKRAAEMASGACGHFASESKEEPSNAEKFTPPDQQDDKVNCASGKGSRYEPEGNALNISPSRPQIAPAETSLAKDSALGLSGDPHQSEPEVMRSAECFSVQAQEKLCGSSVLSAPCTPKSSFLNSSALLDHVDVNPESRLWPGPLESPLPPPKLNSTALPQSLSCTPVPVQVSKAKETIPDMTAPPLQLEKFLAEAPLVGNGPLQQQLRQMAELLMLASGKVALTSAPVPVERDNVAAGTTAAERRSVSAWTTPVRRVGRSVNTSGQVELVKEVLVSEASTSTDSLLWNLNPGSLESLTRAELEQRLTSTLIMVEALFQQLASARGHGQHPGPAPSDLRDKVVQTHHTELSQMETYKDLYVIALERIQSLELDNENLQSLQHGIQNMRDTMTSLKADTEEALTSMREIGDVVSEDQESLSRQVGQMKSMYERCRETLRRMEQKTRDCLQERDHMRQRMEEALEAKEAAFSVTRQVRAHHAAQTAELEENLGSHQDLMTALSQAHPLQVELNKAYVECLTAANELLTKKHDDHVSLCEEMKKAHVLLQRTKPVLLKLHERACEAVEQSQQHLAHRNQALEERSQIEEELNQAQANLQEASEQIRDRNTQMTIMMSEMTVLRQQLGEVEEERTQLQRKSTELSATVTSTLASYAFLEQALAAETSKLQQSLKEAQEARERANDLSAALEASQRQVEELTETLSQREVSVRELHTQVETQSLQLRQFSQVQTELCGAREMCEFLQAENELSREQMAETEGLLRSHLQGLRERNLQCEDLKLALEQLRSERDNLREELVGTRSKAQSMLLEQGEQLAQATNDVTLLHHTVRCLITSLQNKLSAKRPEPLVADKPAQPQFQVQRHPSCSFVDSVMVAMTTEQREVSQTGPNGKAGVGESEPEGIGSRSSAFTRIARAAPEKHEEERMSTVVELLSDLGETVSELASTIQELQQHKEKELSALQEALAGLQGELQREANRHTMEATELKEQVDRLQAQVEKNALALQQKTEEERTLRKLCSEMEENIEAGQRLRVENNELKRSLQQSQVEVQALREALTQSGGQSASLDEKIRLLKEVEKLKSNLLEAEESRTRLLERAKKHQMVYTMNQNKLERELHLLDNVIDTVRKTLSSIPEVVSDCAELQKLVEFLG